MAKVFSAPSSVQKPVIDWVKDTVEQRQAKEQKYLDDLKAVLKKRKPRAQYVGEIVKWPWADGYAMYMVAGLSPVELVHLDLGDGWQYPDADLQTKASIVDKIESEKRFNEFWNKEKAKQQKG